MSESHRITLLGAGLIGNFYTSTLHAHRRRDRVHTVCAASDAEAQGVRVPSGASRDATADMKKAVRDPETDLVVVALPNDLHKKAVLLAAEAGKAVLCTKPLARTAAEALEMLEAVEKAGVFAGYLEDLVYTPKTLKSLASVRDGALGKVLWVRSRETHPGPHSAWFWDKQVAGGGAIVDMGCHCIEIIRNFVGKDVRPVEVMCTADTMVHPIDAEDSGIGLIRFENGAIGQFEVSWTFRGGMDLRDEVAGTEGTIWLDHFLRTGFEMFTAEGPGRLRGREGGDREGLAVPGGRRGPRAGLPAHVLRHARCAGRGTRADGDVPRRLRRQRDHRRVLPVGGLEALGADRARAVARGRDARPPEGGRAHAVRAGAAEGHRHQGRTAARRQHETDREGPRRPAASRSGSRSAEARPR